MSTAPQHTAPTTGRNRRTGRAVLAGVVAAGLLAAGGGTFAKWSDEAAAVGSTGISTGSLSLENVSGPTWTFADGEAYDPATDRIVPGDTLQFTTTAVVDARGKNLDADLSLAYEGATKQYLDYAVGQGLLDYDVEVTGLADTDDDSAYDVTSADDGETVTVTGTFTWIGDSVTGTQYQNQKITFDGISLQLEQK